MKLKGKHCFVALSKVFIQNKFSFGCVCMCVCVCVCVFECGGGDTELKKHSIYSVGDAIAYLLGKGGSTKKRLERFSDCSLEVGDNEVREIPAYRMNDCRPQLFDPMSRALGQVITIRGKPKARELVGGLT